MAEPGSSSGRRPPPPAPGDDDLIYLGRLTRPQGHRGAIRMLPEFQPLDRFEQLKTDELILRRSPKSPLPSPDSPPVPSVVHVEGFFFHQQFIMLELQEIPDMNAAERLREYEVFCHEEDLWDLEPGKYFNHQLKGLNVFRASDGEQLGQVLRVQEGAVYDFLEVRPPEGKNFLVPYIPSMVLRVDLHEKRVEVELPPGLTEL